MKKMYPKLHSYKLKPHVRVSRYHDRKKEISDEEFLKDLLVNTLNKNCAGMGKATIIGVLEQIKIHVYDN